MHLESPLGKKTVYVYTYDPGQLFPIPRQQAREKINLANPLPFNKGVDIWTGYELSWLNLKGKPEVAYAEFRILFNTPLIVESKSLKLYLNSFNQTPFRSIEHVKETLKKDLSEAVQGDVEVELFDYKSLKMNNFYELDGICIDDLDIETSVYKVDAALLKVSNQVTAESFHTHLLKSNCLATGQPDWGSLFISYKGPKIDHESFLRYVVSFRTHSGFAEHCVEQIYHDIQQHCQPELLTVYARYTRRGGLDINPFRSNFQYPPENFRLVRQ